MIITILALFFNSFVFSQDGNCKVYGISDSPQKLSCLFKNGESLTLTCSRRSYYFNHSTTQQEGLIKVTAAYHHEVEEGSNPLVFESGGYSLTVVKKENKFNAVFKYPGKIIRGSCH